LVLRFIFSKKGEFGVKKGEFGVKKGEFGVKKGVVIKPFLC
jgi:hypothetical protein